MVDDIGRMRNYPVRYERFWIVRWDEIQIGHLVDLVLQSTTFWEVMAIAEVDRYRLRFTLRRPDLEHHDRFEVKEVVVSRSDCVNLQHRTMTTY